MVFMSMMFIISIIERLVSDYNQLETKEVHWAMHMKVCRAGTTSICSFLRWLLLITPQ
jgi:hypothetical protein